MGSRFLRSTSVLNWNFMFRTSLFILMALGGLAAHGGVIQCPDSTYASIPIAGVTDGTASSCGNANVFATQSFAATPGDGSVAVDVLELYLNQALTGVAPSGYLLTEGSAVQFAGFTVPGGGTLSFDWLSSFEEGGVGALFYILNGDLTVLELIVPDGRGLPGVSNSGSETVTLLAGVNTFSFGAVSLVPEEKLAGPFLLADPQLTLTNMAVNASGVPEPATYALTGLALAGLAMARRRK